MCPTQRISAQIDASEERFIAAKLRVTYPVVFMDIEIPGNAPDYTPASDNGWNAVYTSACGGVVRSRGIAARVDRADLNGFAAYLTGQDIVVDGGWTIW